MITLDANEAVASVAYRSNEVIVLYPITPSSPMGEWCDEWSAHRKPNLWGTVPEITEMQSEGGAIGAVHGALQAGSLATTFVAFVGVVHDQRAHHDAQGQNARHQHPLHRRNTTAFVAPQFAH
jgi:pyruvate-ferredoxin/flavodoxin oxidoreductase